MPLHSIGNALLVVGNRFLQVCCSACGLGKKICSPQPDECGNVVLQCVDSEEGSPACPAACAEPPPPCECGPTKECDTCYECVERQCERIEGCCADGTPCPACSKCENGSCVPCGECEQCSGGECVPCGPCQKCVDGTCGPCEADEECVNGVCVKKKYWCCWDSCADKLANTNNTTCKAEITPGVSPCGTGTYVAQNGSSQTCDLTKSGPYNSLKGTQPSGTGGCEVNCQRYACTPDACGINRCVKNPNGQYATKAECEAACGDPCDAPCTFAGGSAPGVYSIDGCEREICVNYSSPAGRPIRVQIWGPIMVDGCPQPGSRVIKRDSGWRGFECCDCPDDRNGGDLDGEPHGTLTWTKPAGATQFEVAVLNPCPVFGISVQLDIKCDDECDELEIARCMCVDGNDCGPECACCGGVCVAPCECGGLADTVNTTCDPDPLIPPQFPGDNFEDPCTCQDGRETQYYGPAPFLANEPITPLRPGVSLLGCHRVIVYASTSYGKYSTANEVSCCVKVKFKKKVYACDGDDLVDVTTDKFVSVAECDNDWTDCQLVGPGLLGGGYANLGNCPEGTYCLKMAYDHLGIGGGTSGTCLETCGDCDAQEPDTGFFDTEPSCVPPP